MQDNNEEKQDNLKDKVEDFTHNVSEKAEEMVNDAKEKAGSFAGKTIDAAEKLLNDVFKKNKPEDAEFTEEAVDPKDIEIAELKKEMDELRDKYVRLYADFDNYKKRNAKEKLDLIQTAGKEVILAMVPVVDDFERALKAAEKSGDTKVQEGVQLIYNKMVSALQSKGLKPMESIGKPFDVEMHEAITEIPAPTAELSGKVIDEVEKGYYLGDKIIRFAKVVVGK
jgi:molecular chaperone GrpE